MDKLKNIFKVNKRIILCLIVITIIGIISGSLFFYLLSNNDRETVIKSIEDFINNINSINYSICLKSNLVINLVLLLIIFIFSLTIIGIPIIIIIYYFKTFSLGFSLVAIISRYGFKGTLYAVIYLFPHNIISLLTFLVLSLYGLIYSFKTLHNFTKKTNINLNNSFAKLKTVLLISIIIIILCSLYQTFIMPKLLNFILNLLN